MPLVILKLPIHFSGCVRASKVQPSICPALRHMSQFRLPNPSIFRVYPIHIDFVAPDERVFNYWTDAINALLDLPMISKQKKEDFDTLLSMEIKLRLLDTEGVDISQEPPPIPEDPENYDFCFES